MSDDDPKVPVELPIPIQWEIGSPQNRPEQNRIMVPAAPRSPLVGPEEAVRLAASVGMDDRLCGVCRHFDLEAGRRTLAIAGTREKVAARMAHRSGWWGEGEFGACRLERAPTLTQATGRCERWEARKLVSFAGQRNHG